MYVYIERREEEETRKRVAAVRLTTQSDRIMLGRTNKAGVYSAL